MTDNLETAWAIIELEFKTVSGGKGKGVADAQRKQTMNMYQTAFNTQQKQLADLKKALSPDLSGGIGYRPEDLAAFRTNFMNSNNMTFNQAGQQVRSALTARGNTGANPVGGDYTRGIASLLGAKAGSQSQGLLNIAMQNAQLANQNKWNAANVLSGNAATLTGTQGVAGSAASSALNDYIRAANTGFGSSFTNAFGGALGQGLGSFVTGGLGKAGAGLGFGYG